MAIVIPGRNQSAAHGIEIVARLQLPALSCAVISAHQDSWYPGRFMDPIAANQPDLDHAMERIDTLIAAARDRGIGPDRIALVGFSQGACLACEYVYRRRARWGAVAILTGGLFGPDDHRWDCDGPGLTQTPTLFTNSDCDPFVPLSRMQQSAAVFRRLGADVRERVYPGREHEISDDEIAATRALLLPLTEENMVAAAPTTQQSSGRPPRDINRSAHPPARPRRRDSPRE